MRRLFFVLLLLLVGLRLSNAVSTSSQRGFDSAGHSENILFLKDGIVPLPSHGPQSYHPPGYPVATNLIGSAIQVQDDQSLLRTGHFVSVFGSLLGICSSLLIAQMLLPAWKWHVALLTALIPADVLTASTVYNGPLAYGLISFFLFLIVRATYSPEPKLHQEVLLGLLAGAATMVRLDCIISLGMLGGLWLFRLWRRVSKRDSTVAFVLALACWLFVVHWFFLRNLNEYGRFLVFNLDPEILPYSFLTLSGNSYPGYVSVSFFTTFDFHIWVDPGSGSAPTSWWSTLFASLWWDNNESFLTNPNLWAARLLLTLGIVPTALWLVGLLETARRHLAHGWPILLIQLGGWSTAVSLFLHHPTLPQVKANFLYTGYTAASFCAVAGMAAVCHRYPKAKIPLEVVLVAIATIVLITFHP